jgi:hypothetical protein
LLHEPSSGDVFLFEGGKVTEIQGSRIEDIGSMALFHGSLTDAPMALRTLALDRWSALQFARP